MRRLIAAVVATGVLCALSANAQQLSSEAISPDEKVSSQQNWVFGTNECNFDATNGSIDRIVGFTAAGDMAWIQAYEVDETCDCIGGVDIQMFRTAANPTDMWEGREVTVYLWDDPTNDFDRLAAVTSALDLVISVGNTTVHLAGSLGTPVWAMLPLAGTWRWTQGHERALWYQSVRLMRATPPDDWGGVLERVRRELADDSRRGRDSEEMPSLLPRAQSACRLSPSPEVPAQ